jgi:hypothetical protein
MLASYETTRQGEQSGMTHPGLFTALMVAAVAEQIAMARQMVNSESHILASSELRPLFLTHSTQTGPPRLSHVLVPRNRRIIFREVPETACLPAPTRGQGTLSRSKKDAERDRLDAASKG